MRRFLAVAVVATMSLFAAAPALAKQQDPTRSPSVTRPCSVPFTSAVTWRWYMPVTRAI